MVISLLNKEMFFLFLQVNWKELEAIASDDPKTNKKQVFYIDEFDTLFALKLPLVAAIYSQLPGKTP